MLLVKVLLLLAGSGTVAGVTYSQIQQDPDTKAVVVSNNHESQVRVSMEKNLNTTLLHNQKKRIEERKTSRDAKLKEKEQAFDDAKKELTKAYDDLNESKKGLNTKSEYLVQKYTELTNKNKELETSLKTKMNHDLSEEIKKLKKEFYEKQKQSFMKNKNRHMKLKKRQLKKS